MVCVHFFTGDTRQLLMYVGSVGGTGKSHLINTLIRFFRKSGFPEMLLLGAPTGSAAVLISGWTLHALCYLTVSDIKSKADELWEIWKNIHYLIIDEVFILSARDLSKILERLSVAKTWDPTVHTKPFGGINVIFM